MNVELTIQDMFDEYPTLFKERADCLNHLFCTIGNGYEWVNGELVEDGYEFFEDYQKNLESKLIKGKAYQYNKMSLRDESIYYYQRKKEQNPETPELTYSYFEKIPEDVYYRNPRNKRWYFYVNIPGHERIDYYKNYAKLWNYPKDIKPDWLEAIEETKTLLREDGFDV